MPCDSLVYTQFHSPQPQRQDLLPSSEVQRIGANFKNLEDESHTQGPVSSSDAQNIKRRVSGCSTHYGAQLCSLIKEFTISNSSDDGRSSGRRPSVARSEVSETDLLEPDQEEMEMSSGVYEAFPDPGFALPGDFLTAHTRSCADFPGQQHGKDCWCCIAQEASADQNSWLLRTGELSERAKRAIEFTSPAPIDSFGNTPLHLFAALEGYQKILFGTVANASLGCLKAVNTAGQTFLHILNLEWFTELTSLERLLRHIRQSCDELLYETDVYGRTFFHRAHSVIRDPSALARLVPPNLTRGLRRDAFGFNPIPNTDPANHGPYIPPRRADSADSRLRASIAESSFFTDQASLLRVIQSSYSNPDLEDVEGRNALHCLAEAILDKHTINRQIRPPPAASTIPKTGPADTETSLSIRLRHLPCLLHPSSFVSPIHYSKHGTTALMAFIEHIPDDQDDKAKTLQTIFKALVQAGARIESRNREGETALLIAARLGRKVAVATLLEMGANVHVRDVQGKGVLEVLNWGVKSVAARADVYLYARLEACRALVMGRREWGVEDVGVGGVVREWRVREGGQPKQSHSTISSPCYGYPVDHGYGE